MLQAEELERFLPGALVAWTSSATRHASTSSCERIDGTLLITDISGFTRLTAKLSRTDVKAGSERIRQVLDDFVSKLAAIIEAQGGTILSFEGDALMAGWRHGPEGCEPAVAARRACWCAKAMQEAVTDKAVLGETLTLRSAVAVGVVDVVHLVLGSGSRHVLVAGPCFREVSRCAALADSGDVLISNETWTLVRDSATGAPQDEAVSLLDISASPTPTWKRGQHDLCGDVEVARYVRPMLRARLGSSLPHWFAELRPVTTLFARIAGADLLESLQTMEAILEVLEFKSSRFRGDLLRVAAVDGGVQALLVFGLPGQAHEDDPRRACLAALELKEAIVQLGLSLSAGIGSGDVFCGAIGTQHRAEYTVLGEAVNRAARLSGLAAGRVLTDEPSAQQANGSVVFDGPWTMQISGIRMPVATFLAIRPKRGADEAAREPPIGRRNELERLHALVDQAARGCASVSCIEGEPGVGKSALVGAFLEECRAKGIIVLAGSADDLERDTPYFAFRRILRQVLQLDGATGSEAQRLVAEKLRGRPEHIRFIPCLNDVLELGLPEIDAVDLMSSGARAGNLQRLLEVIVADALGSGPSVLVVEDVHWLDPASEALLSELKQANNRSTIVLTARPDRRASLDSLQGFMRWNLEALGKVDSSELISLHLGEREIPTWLRDAIWERTGGNPFFIGEICRVLKRDLDSGVLVNRGQTHMPNDTLVALPLSAQAAILARMDLLPSGEHFLLKVASAVGTSFTAAGLAAVDLIQTAGVHVASALTNLVEAQLVVPDGSSGFAFSHAIVREVIYSSMLSDQRRRAHASIAEALERAEHPNDAETLPLVLYQWQRAENRRGTFEYLDRVAELRLRQFDNATAIALTTSFIATAREEALSVSAERLASAHFVQGAAELSLGRYQSAQTSYEAGLHLLGMPVPASTFGLKLRLATQIGEHLVGSALRSTGRHSPRRRFRATAAPGDDVLLKAARAHEDLTRIYYFQGDKARLVYATLRATNLAERASQLSPVLVVNYASLGAICGVIPLRKRAESYLKLAGQLSTDIGTPAVAVRIDQMSGLYDTSVGQWRSARAHFEAGMCRSQELGDNKRWLELAIGLETITNPAFLNPSFNGEEAWRALIADVIRVGRTADDPHMLGCGLTGALRGHLALGAEAPSCEYLAQLSAMMEQQAHELEPISRLEGAAFMAEAARIEGDMAAYGRWLEQASHWLDEVNPAIKSRTVAPLVAVFQAGAACPFMGELVASQALRASLAQRSAENLQRFARIYPIGRPRACLFRGDIEALRGNENSARRLWRRALHEAVRLEMPADGIAALARVRQAGRTLNGAEQRDAEALEHIRAVFTSDWGDVAERSAAMLRMHL